MLIDIVGGGAVGLLLGARLAESGGRVRIRTRTAAQAAAIRNSGIALEAGGRRRRLSAEAVPAGQPAGEPAEAVLLTVKRTALAEPVFRVLRSAVRPGVPVVCLQNGIGHMELLRSALPEIAFSAAVTTIGALRTGSASVRHTGEGQLWMEPVREPAGCADEGGSDAVALRRQKLLADLLEAGGIPSFLSNDMDIHIYRKLLINAVINPLTALYGVRNGELPAEPARRTLLEALCAETAGVLASRGFRMDKPLAAVLGVCAATADNESSMLADVRAGRPTEVDGISGGVVRLAAEAGLGAPLNQAMAELIRALTPRESGR